MSGWFENKNCSLLEINFVDRKSKPYNSKSIQLKDAEAITRLMSRIEKIPAKGDEMISMIVGEEVNLNFTCDGKVSTVSFYNGLLKTPSTAFHSDAKWRALGSGIHTDIINLLNPAFGKRILKAKDFEVVFGKMKVIYKGLMIREQGPDEPSIGPLATETYVVQDQTGKGKNLGVTSGQTAPQPLKFEFGGQTFTLRTFTDRKNERLDPDYFVIDK